MVGSWLPGMLTTNQFLIIAVNGSLETGEMEMLELLSSMEDFSFYEESPQQAILAVWNDFVELENA